MLALWAAAHAEARWNYPWAGLLPSLMRRYVVKLAALGLGLRGLWPGPNEKSDGQRRFRWSDRSKEIADWSGRR
jgi:hypothetical protein